MPGEPGGAYNRARAVTQLPLSWRSDDARVLPLFLDAVYAELRNIAEEWLNDFDGGARHELYLSGSRA